VPKEPRRWSASLSRVRAHSDRSATADALVSSRPNSCPSGINGLSLNKGDHLALFVLDDSTNSHVDLVFDYISAGITSSAARECLSLELTKGQSADAAKRRLERSTGRSLPSTVDIRNWERNADDYTPEHFDRHGMWKAMTKELERLEDVPNSMLRVASADCTAFMRWLSNPAEYVIYEHELASDLKRILEGRPFVQLCVFKADTLSEIAADHHFDGSAALLDLALSHNRILLVANNRLYHDADAAKRLLRETWPPKTRAGWIRWVRVLARLRRGRR
jgi:hypothetical protein